MTPNKILKDAKAVAAYGASSGKLDTNDLFDAIQKATAASNLNWNSVELVQLQRALNDAIPKIAPFTPKSISMESGLVKALLLVIGIITLYYCAVFTIWYNQTSSVLVELDKGKSRTLEEAVEGLIPVVAIMAEQDEFSNYSNIGGAGREELRRKIREINLIKDQISRDAATYDYYNKIRPSALDDIVSIGDWIVAKVPSTAAHGANKPDELAAADLAAVDARKFAASVATPSGSSTNVSQIQANFEDSRIRNCLLNLSLGPAFREGAAVAYMFSLIQRDEMKLKRTLGCLIGTEQGNQLYDTFRVRYTLSAWSDWLLPALYGLLGAIIYQLREYFSAAKPDAPVLKVILRLSLGAFAGVAIGWFWKADGFGSLTLTALTVAFLVGYSIEVFMSLLDKIVALLETWIVNLGGPKPGDPAALAPAAQSAPSPTP